MSSVPRCPASTTGSVSPAGWRRGCSSCSARPVCSSRAAAPVAYRRSADAAGRSRLLSPAPAVVLLPVGHVVAGCLQRLPLVACLRHRRLVAAVEQHRSEEHTSELQSLMRISYAVFCLKKKNRKKHHKSITLVPYST